MAFITESHRPYIACSPILGRCKSGEAFSATIHDSQQQAAINSILELGKLFSALFQLHDSHSLSMDRNYKNSIKKGEIYVHPTRSHFKSTGASYRAR